MAIQIIKKGITKLEVDAIVNAANSQLQAGGGVCGAIFEEAGYKELTAACRKIGHCETGSAVITPGFSLKAKYIIHAAGPIWNGGNSGEAKLLHGSYFSALELAKANGCHSIGFPLISSGIFGYPKDKAWKEAIQACQDFLAQNHDYDIDIYFAVLDEKIQQLGEKIRRELDDAQSKCESEYSKQKDFCRKYYMLLRTLHEDIELRKWCNDFSVYAPVTEHNGLERILSNFMHEAYNVDLVIHDYRTVIEESKLDERLVSCPTDAFVKQLNDKQIIACIAWHFRRDHFSEGSLISDSIGNGALLRYFEALSFPNI